VVLIFTAVWPEREATPSGKVKSLLYSLEQDGVVAKKKVADLLVDVLAEAGVRRIYGVSGDSLNGITDSIRKREQIQRIHVRHEETAAFAARAEAHLRGRLAACAGSCGPGNLHLINGLYDCQRSRAPVLAIAAQIPSNEIGSGYFQETHPEHLWLDTWICRRAASSVVSMTRGGAAW